MASKTAHEPGAEVMSAADVWDDAHRLSEVLQRNEEMDDHLVRLQIPLSAYLSALEDLSWEELRILRGRVEERLAPS